MNTVKYVIGLSVIMASSIYAAETATVQKTPATEIKQPAEEVSTKAASTTPKKENINTTTGETESTIQEKSTPIKQKPQTTVEQAKETPVDVEKPTTATTIPATPKTTVAPKPAETKTVPTVKQENITPPKTTTETPKPITKTETPVQKPVAKPEIPEKEPIKLPPTVTTTSPGYYESSSDWKTSIADDYSSMHELLGDKIHIGLRIMDFSLDDTDRSASGQENYLGTIDELHEEQESSLPVAFTFGVYPVRNFGIEYRYDKITARTTTETYDKHSDGDFVTEGPIFIAVARLPLDQVVTLFNKMSGNESIDHDTTAHNIARRFIPYAGIGYAALSGDFEESTWWGHGFASAESWEELGSPTEGNRNGYSRELRVKNEDVGPYYLIGISIRIINTFYVDVSYSQESVDLDTDFYLGGQYQYTKTIPMDYTSTSIAIRYYF